MRTTIAALCMFLLCSTMAQTTVSGGIFTDATWTLGGSPYHITDNVVLFDNLTLTVEPGVVIQIDAGKTFELRNSTLVAIGTASQAITFERAGTENWGGFLAVGTTEPLFTGNQVQMEHCIGTGANRFMDLDIGYHTPYNFINCEFANNGITFEAGPVSFVQGQYFFDQCNFHDNTTALEGGYYYTVSNSNFSNNVTAVQSGAWVVDSFFSGNHVALKANGHIDGNVFVGNDIAVEGNWNAGNNLFTNNVVVGNEKGVRIGTFFNGSEDFTNNTICNNTIWNIERFAMGSNNTADLSGNCFCTADQATIEESIFHAVDDISVGLVIFSPFITDPGCLNFSIGITDRSISTWQLAPNPASESIRINIEANGANTFRVYDVQGVLIRIFMRNGTDMFDIDLLGMPSGVYNLVDENGLTKRFVKL